MKIFFISLPNIKYGRLIPAEDSFLFHKNVFCVADGITRDPIGIDNFNGALLSDFAKSYPKPSGASIAADEFCQTFIKRLKNKKTINLKMMRQAFVSGNKAIGALNKKFVRETDYLANDWWGCVACGGAIIENSLYWGAICDCGIAIFDRFGFLKFRTRNWMNDFLRYETARLNRPDFNWNDAEYRKKVRSKFRNNYKISAGYGALTGECTAEKFMHFDKIDLERGDLIVFYTDGFEKTISQRGFFKAVYQEKQVAFKNKMEALSFNLSKKNYSDYGKERTLIAVIYED